jgi:hypothetical protein
VGGGYEEFVDVRGEAAEAGGAGVAGVGGEASAGGDETLDAGAECTDAGFAIPGVVRTWGAAETATITSKDEAISAPCSATKDGVRSVAAKSGTHSRAFIWNS